MTVVYRKRKSLFEWGEEEWRVENDVLVECTPKRRETRFPWREVTHVRSSYSPGQYATWRHMLVLTLSNGKHVTINNAHFKGIGSFEDRSASYVPFVRAAVARIVAEAPHATAQLGANRAMYYLGIGFLTLIYLLVALLLLFLPGATDNLGIVRLLMVALLLPLFIRWVIKARPRGATLDVESLTADLPKPA